MVWYFKLSRMPNYIGLKPNSEVVILPKCVLDSPIKIFEVPHPSNNTSKNAIKLFIHDNVVYQLQTKHFSKGSPYNKDQDEANDLYHYTADGHPYKSIIAFNPNKTQEEGIVLESGAFDYHTKYDLAYSLCKFYYRLDVVNDESAYSQADPSIGIKQSSNFLTLRDFQDVLVDQDGDHWLNVPSQVLDIALHKVCDTIEEAGDKYFKIVEPKILKWLVAKVPRIISVFPESLPFPKDIPDEYLKDIQTCWAVNIMISLLPRSAYWALRNYSNSEIDIIKAYENMSKYKQELVIRNKENNVLINAAMSVGSTRSCNTKHRTNPRSKTIKNPKKIPAGKGAIDSFFKKL